uniref:Uncharacterized protein n=1 Tax=Solanum tuberosum TaxID=4113 RepID=M0ZTA4_SOLTU
MRKIPKGCVGVSANNAFISDETSSYLILRFYNFSYMQLHNQTNDCNVAVGAVRTDIDCLCLYLIINLS